MGRSLAAGRRGRTSHWRRLTPNATEQASNRWGIMKSLTTAYLLDLYWKQVSQDRDFIVESILVLGFYRPQPDGPLMAYFRRGAGYIGYSVATALADIGVERPGSESAEVYGPADLDPRVLSDHFQRSCEAVREFATAIGFDEVQWSRSGSETSFILGYPDVEQQPSWQAMEDALYLAVSRTLARSHALFIGKLELDNPGLGESRVFTGEPLRNLVLYQGEFGLESLYLNAVLDDNGLPTADSWQIMVDIDLPSSIGPGADASAISLPEIEAFYAAIMQKNHYAEGNEYSWVVTQKLIHRVAARLEREQPFGTASVKDGFRVFVQQHDMESRMDSRLAAFARARLSLSCSEYMADFDASGF